MKKVIDEIKNMWEYGIIQLMMLIITVVIFVLYFF